VCCTHLNDDESVHQQHADERVLAREEHVRVAEDAVLEDEQHSQDEERAVLHEDRHDDDDDGRGTDRTRNGPSCMKIDIMMPITSGVQQALLCNGLVGAVETPSRRAWRRPRGEEPWSP